MVTICIVLLFNFADSWFVINYEFLFLMQSYGVKIKKNIALFYNYVALICEIASMEV